MHTIRSQFTHIGCAETTGEVQAQIEVIVDIANGPDATCHAVEMTCKIHETLFAILLQSISMQSAVVITHATIQRPAFAKAFRGSGIDTEVEETIVWNQILLALVARLLIHTADARRKFPAIPLIGNVTQIVGQGVQFEIQFVFISTLFKLLTSVLLVADDSLEVT